MEGMIENGHLTYERLAANVASSIRKEVHGSVGDITNGAVSAQGF